MCSRARPLLLALGAALAAGCGPSDGPLVLTPAVDHLEPACGDSAAATTVAVLGSMPVMPEVSMSGGGNRIVTDYRAWVGDVELGDVTWIGTQRITAKVPAGLPAGVYPLTVQSPFGTRSTKDAAFEVRQGACPVQGAVLAITTTAAPATVVVGQQVTVTATVRNDGRATAVAVAASVASVPVGLALSTGPAGPQDVPGSEERTFTWTYTATDPGGGAFAIDAAGTSAESGLPVAAPRASTNAVLVNPATFLTANTEVTPGQVDVGQAITVALTVTNHATSSARVTPSLVATGPIQAGNTPAVFDLAGGTAHTFVWTYTAIGAGEASFTASASGTDPGTGTLVTVPTALVKVTVQTAAALTATLAIPPKIELGPFTVTMTVSNVGGATAVAVVPDAPAKQAGSTADASLTSGPTGSPADVASGRPATVFTWIFTAKKIGTLTLAAAAHGTDANTHAAVSTGVVVSNQAAVGLHTVGGTVSGLAAGSVVLHVASQDLTVSANGPYQFTAPLPTGTTYTVSVKTQPKNPSQTCTVANASGTIGATDVTNVNVTCSTKTFTLGGSVSGLAGSGLILANGGTTTSIPAGATSYTFPTAIPSGTAYAVTVSVQPTNPSQTCTVANPNGTVGTADVTNVNVTCSTNTFTLGGAVSGLAGTGLTLSNGGSTVTIPANATVYTFTTPIASGTAYAVTVSVQPTNPSQTCTVANPNGTIGGADVTNANVSCTTSSFPVHVTVSGLAAGNSLVLQQDGADNLTADADGAYTFATPVPSGSVYAVSVFSQTAVPPQVCTVTGGSDGLGGGVMGAAAVDVTVTCI